MKKLLLVLVLLMLLVPACGPGRPSDKECDLYWRQMEVESGDEGLIVDMILNTKHPPDSIGSALEECINGGWVGWR